MSNITTEFKQIVLENRPLIDVRAPIEYKKGAFKNAFNFPIMTDQERHLVGIEYKENGNEAATELGHKLVSGETKQQRLDSWITFINNHPNAMMYCFRGGQRSRISQEWLKDAGYDIPRLEGGYKAFRNYLMSALEPSYQKTIPIRLGGYTGSGKTILLNKLEHSIDLEGIANHRGSSFGRYIDAQPTQINFENNLAYALINHRHKAFKHLILEDEGRHIGKCFLPNSLAEFFDQGDLVLMEVPFERRVEITLDEYVHQSQKRYINAFSEDGLIEWHNYLTNSITKIKKRLGGYRYSHVMKQFNDAYNHQLKTGDESLHRHWIETILHDYYDPMYQYQIEKRTSPVLFKGNEQETYEFLKELSK